WQKDCRTRRSRRSSRSAWPPCATTCTTSSKSSGCTRSWRPYPWPTAQAGSGERLPSPSPPRAEPRSAWTEARGQKAIDRPPEDPDPGTRRRRKAARPRFAGARTPALAQALEERERELRILSALASRIHNEEDVRTILQAALQEILAGLGLDAAWVLLGDG